MKACLREYMLNTTGIDSCAIDEFLSIFEENAFKAKEHFIYKGLPCDRIAFVQEGIFREYYVDRSGAEITMDFFNAPAFVVNDCIAYPGSECVQRSIQALTDATLLTGSVEAVCQIADKNMIINKAYRIILEEVCNYHQEREISRILHTATERYQQFIVHKEEVAKQVPLDYIASYLEIKPEKLKRIHEKNSKESMFLYLSRKF